MPSDFGRIKDNVQKMVDQGAPAEHIDGYLSDEGFTPKEFKLANENYGTFVSAVKRGGKGLSSLLADVLPAMGADLVEKIAPESLKPKIEEYKQRQWKEAAATQEEIAKKYPAQYESYKDIEGPLGALGYAKEALGENLPSFIPSVLTGGAAGIASRGAVAGAAALGERAALEAAKRAALSNVPGAAEEFVSGVAARRAAQEGAKAGARKALQYEATGAFGGSALQTIPEAYQGLYTPENQDILLPAIASGTFNALLDSITPLNMLRTIKGKGITGDAIMGAWYKRGAKELGKGVLTEGTTEALQEMSNAAAEKYVDQHKEFFTPENLTRFIDAGLKGGIGGGVMQGAAGVAFGKNAPKETPTQIPKVGPLTPAQAGATPLEAPAPYTPLTGERDLFGMTPEEQLAAPTEKMRPILGPEGQIVGYRPAAPQPTPKELEGAQLHLQPAEEDLLTGQPSEQPTPLRAEPLVNEKGEPIGPEPTKPLPEFIREKLKEAKESPDASTLLKANNPATANAVAARLEAIMHDAGNDTVRAMEMLYEKNAKGEGKALSPAQAELLDVIYRRMTGRQIDQAVKERAFRGATQGELFGGERAEGKTEPDSGTTPPNVGVPGEQPGGVAGGAEGAGPTGVGVGGGEPGVGGPAGGEVPSKPALNPEEAWNVHKNEDHPEYSALSPEEKAAWDKYVAQGSTGASAFQDVTEMHRARVERETKRTKEQVEEALLRQHKPGLDEDIEQHLVGKSFDQVLKFLSTHGPEANRQIALKMIQRVKELRSVGFTFKFKVAQTPADVQKVGGYEYGVLGRVLHPGNTKVMDISIAGKGSGQPFGAQVRTMTHEALHAVTAALIIYGETKGNEKTPAGKIAKQLKDISNYVRNYLEEKQRTTGLTAAEDHVLNGTNALGNHIAGNGRYHQAHEMISHGMTTPELMMVLETIPYTKGKSVASKFVQLIRELLGLAPKEATALAEVMRLSEEIMSTGAAPLQSARLKGARLRSTAWSERDIPSQFGREEALGDLYEKMRNAYDEFDSPQEAYDAIYESATPGEQSILRQLQKENFLGFDYPHQAIQAIIEEPESFDLSPQLKAAISRVGNQAAGITGVKEAITSAEVNSIQPAAPAPSRPVPAPGQPYNLPKLTKLEPAPTTGAQIKQTVEKINETFHGDWWTKFRIAAVDKASGLMKTLESLPVFQNGQLRADMLLRAFNQVINLIKNGLQSGIPVLNSDGTITIQRSDVNLRRSQILADELDTNPTVQGSGLSGRAYVAEIARIKRGEEIMQEDAAVRAKAEQMMAEARALRQKAKLLRQAGAPLPDILRVLNKAKQIQARWSEARHLNREKQVLPEHIVWADQQLEAGIPQVGEIFRIWRETNVALINLNEAVGNLDAETADRYRSKKYYVPLFASRVDLRPEEQEHYTGKRPGTKSVAQQYHLEGSTDIRNIWENIDKHYASATASAYQNQTRKVAVQQLMSDGINAAKYAKNASDPNINLRFRDPTNPFADDNGIVHVILDNPNDLAAFQMMPQEIGFFLKGFSASTQVLRTGALINPMYWIKQLIRDPLHAALVTNSGIVTPFHAAKEYINVLANSSEEARILMERGVIGQIDPTIDIHDFLKQVGTEKMNPKKLDSLIHKVMRMHEASDAATRVSIYKNAYKEGLAKGMSEADAKNYAVHVARESINFSVRGNSKILNTLRHMIPFFSAAITSLDTLYRAASGYGLNAKEKAEIQRVFMSRAAMMVVLSSVYAMTMQDDDDYKKLPDNVKDDNWLLPSPIGSEHTFVKIPVPFEIGFMFKTIPEGAIRYMADNSTGKEVVASYIRGLQRNLPGEGIMIPQAVKPILETVTNYSFFTKRPIEGMADQGLPVEMRGPNASDMAKTLSKLGLSEIGLSPVKIDHLIQGYTAELGTFTSGVASTLLAQADGKEPPAQNIEKMPFFRAFLTDPNTSKAATDFYELMHNSQEAVNAFNRLKKEGRAEEAKAFVESEENRKAMAAAPTLRQIQGQMSKIRSAINFYQNNQTMDPEERRQRINQLQTTYDRVAQQGYKVATAAGISR